MNTSAMSFGLRFGQVTLSKTTLNGYKLNLTEEDATSPEAQQLNVRKTGAHKANFKFAIFDNLHSPYDKSTFATLHFDRQHAEDGIRDPQTLATKQRALLTLMNKAKGNTPDKIWQQAAHGLKGYFREREWWHHTQLNQAMGEFNKAHEKLQAANTTLSDTLAIKRTFDFLG